MEKPNTIKYTNGFSQIVFLVCQFRYNGSFLSWCVDIEYSEMSSQISTHFVKIELSTP